MAEIKKNWIIFLMSMVVSVSTALLVQSFTKINKAATIEYVDQGDEKLEGKIEAQRLESEKHLQKKANQTTVDLMQIQIRDNNVKLDKTLTDMNENLIKIWQAMDKKKEDK